MKIKVLIILCLFFSNLSAQTPQRLESNKLWLGIKTGVSQSKINGLDEWLATEGLSRTYESKVNHKILGFDLMYELGRIPIGLSPTFHLTSQAKQMTFLIDITFQSGYTFIQRDKINLKALCGIGFGYAGIDFNGVPASFQSIAANYSDPYARLSFFNLRPSLMLSYTPFYQPNPNNNGHIHLQPIFYCQAGFNYFFGHSWKYGEVSNNSVNEENSFSGTPVSMPAILKNNLFISFGIAFAMQSK